ncbi:MAG TPA: MarR family transcriptional regulator [Thermoanaerobaculia bacterium]|nr:MarR family transcriptional regulator [Thermoanaerobaculia bacterium]
MAATLLPIAPSDRALDRDARALHGALSDLIRVYQFRDRDRICCHDISVTQCYGLESLALCGAQTLNELAAHLYLDKSTASRVVDALERKGYVVRAPHPTDGRAVLLELTSAGRTLYERIEREILAEERDLLAGFDPEIRQAMTQLVARLARAAATRVEAGGGSCCRLP